MRKIFRFQYEPCNGTCYHWCDHLPLILNSLSPSKRKGIVKLMVKAHNNLCDNPNYSFGVDLDEKTGLVVGHFRTPEKTNTYLGSFFECVTEVCNEVLSEKIPSVKGACTYGDNGAESLGKDILRACTDIAYREEHHKNCPCHKAS